MTRVLRLLLALGVALWLAGCGDFGGLTDSRVRLVNATSEGYDRLDLLVDGERRVVNVGVDAVSAYDDIDSGSYDIALAHPPSTQPLAEATRTIAGDTDHTLVAYGRVGSLKAVLLADDAGEPDSGEARLRVLHGAADAGPIDVYLTGADDPLADATPVLAGVTADEVSGFVTVDSGNRRLRVTAAGDRDDVRLDVGVTLGSRRVSTLVVKGTAGGVLVDGLLVTQDSSVPGVLANPAARVRVVAAIAGGPAVTVQLGGDTLAAAQPSPQVGEYRTVPAGDAQALQVTVGGVPVAGLAPLDVSAGADLSLLVYGRADAPQVRLIADDNRRPTTAGSAALRLLHAVAGLDETMTLTVGLTPRGSAGYGEASAPTLQTAGTGLQLQASSPTAPAVKWSDADVTLDAGSVYTVFVLGSFDDPATTLVGTLRRDR